MEKGSNSNKSTKFSKMLQRALSIGHSAAPFSPGRDFHQHRMTSTVNRGIFFSSPLVPTAARVRRRTKNESVFAEPTSPKVSCIGQVKLNKPKFSSEKKTKEPNKNLKTASSLSSCVTTIKEEDKGGFSKLKRLFSTKSFLWRKSNSNSTPTAFARASEYPAAAVEVEPVAAVEAPSLGKMKKFSSSRGALGGFDWTAEMKRQESQSNLTIPCSVSMPLTQLEGLSLCPKPKSEVNLWKRRTMDRPKALQVN